MTYAIFIRFDNVLIIDNTEKPMAWTISQLQEQPCNALYAMQFNTAKVMQFYGVAFRRSNVWKPLFSLVNTTVQQCKHIGQYLPALT